MSPPAELDAQALQEQLHRWGKDLGFDAVAVSRVKLGKDAAHLQAWLDAGMHGGMSYMERNTTKRAEPAALRPGTLSVISARMNYLPPAADPNEVLQDREKAYIARYALGRDYHRTIRSRLVKLARRLQDAIEPFGYRVFTDSAPILEKAMARDAGLGWIGKHTLLLDRKAGSYFLLGEIYCDLALPVADEAAPKSHCGSCQACIDICPTNAIVAPGKLDARRCISYLTIENRGPIPIEFRKAVGNRVFGCDDCQLVCPWNRYAQTTSDKDFAPRHGLDAPKLTELFAWSEQEYLDKTEGMALRRPGWNGWLRNLAVALGNAPRSGKVVEALRARVDHPDEMVREHVAWALKQQGQQGQQEPQPAAPD